MSRDEHASRCALASRVSLDRPRACGTLHHALRLVGADDKGVARATEDPSIAELRPSARARFRAAWRRVLRTVRRTTSRSAGWARVGFEGVAQPQERLSSDASRPSAGGRWQGGYPATARWAVGRRSVPHGQDGAFPQCAVTARAAGPIHATRAGAGLIRPPRSNALEDVTTCNRCRCVSRTRTRSRHARRPRMRDGAWPLAAGLTRANLS